MRRRYSIRYRRKKSIWPKFIILFLLVLTTGSYVYTGDMFERVKPTITAPKVVYTDTKESIKVILEDNMALGQYQAIFSDGNRTIITSSGSFDMPIKRTEISIPFPPQLQEGKDGSNWSFIVVAKDKSLWNYIGDNTARKRVNIVADTKPPAVKLISKSVTIARGGSALVIFKAKDANLEKTYIRSGGIKFEAVPYRKNGYYATLIAWPFYKKKINIFIIAEDIAGNRTKKKITFPKILRQYKRSDIVVSDRFLNGKIAEVATMDPEVSKIKGKFKRFKAVNENMRIANEDLIHSYTKKVNPKKLSKRWKIKPFYPLKSAKLVADFGVERHYFYKNKKREISKSYHVGYDFASTKHAPIVNSNSGRVVYSGENGIYGKMLIINHGFGLYTLYGHCSNVFIEDGEDTEAGQVIAKSGTTGLALGDHLHFGILIQGVEVWPMDWMRKNWIKKNIDNVFQEADRIIGK